jgi:hypothetical protein
VLEQPQQVGGIGFLADAHLDPRPVLLEAAEEPREDACADRLEDADAEWAGGAFRERGHVRLGGVELRHDRVGVPEKQAAGVGEVDGSGPARPLDEPLADLALEVGDLLAHGRLGVAEVARGPAERARSSDRLEGGDVAQLDAEKAITFHDQHEW